MKLWSSSFADNSTIPGEFAFGVIHPTDHVTLSANRNPQLAWSDLPAKTRSLALICHDPDVPSRGDDVNQEGHSVPASLPRVDFFHWILVDLLPTPAEIAAGEYSRDITPRGKSGPQAAHGARQGLNDYTGWFAGDAAMSGNYYGYDGPCPPWNDEIRHRYVFTLYALDIERCGVEGDFTGQQVLDALAGHILAQASFTGVYTLNPSLAG
ncbi:MAG: YbhB/YbcL family Raf kinase inhibitor-like protein [Sterolibacteriaceae bacterium]|nr:YbhB/YbcL family Raf kinase inhibitor-like protein [Sterolibacteriaceae bacterium]MBK9084869.1 YbhB/YbcL family Raf kinase inhibitor-like protein [Sterolibacteriaceae bacterium]